MRNGYFRVCLCYAGLYMIFEVFSIIFLLQNHHLDQSNNTLTRQMTAAKQQADRHSLELERLAQAGRVHAEFEQEKSEVFIICFPNLRGSINVNAKYIASKNHPSLQSNQTP